MISLNAKDRRGILFALLGFSLFSIGDIFIKLLADDGFEPAEIAFYQSLFFLPYLILLSPWIGGIRASLRTEKLWLHILRALLGFCIFLLNINAFQKLGLSLSYTLIFAAPFFATIMSALFLKDRVHTHRWTAVITGFAGVLIVLQPWQAEIKMAAIGLIISALLISITHLIARKIGEDEPLMAFSLFSTVIGVYVFGILTFWDGAARIPQGSEWFYMAMIPTFHVGGALLTSRAFSMTETALVAPFHYVQLLWGTAFGILIFSTVPDIWTGIGALIIVFSGIYLIHREHVRHKFNTTGVTSHGGFDQE